MKRIRIELLALGFAAATTALLAEHRPSQECRESGYLNAGQARAESALYLEAPPTHARLDRATRRWMVTDGHTTAWLDARSGEVVEVSFEALRAEGLAAHGSR
jgi:hypothetical protein